MNLYQFTNIRDQVAKHIKPGHGPADQWRHGKKGSGRHDVRSLRVGPGMMSVGQMKPDVTIKKPHDWKVRSGYTGYTWDDFQHINRITSIRKPDRMTTLRIEQMLEEKRRRKARQKKKARYRGRMYDPQGESFKPKIQQGKTY